MQTPTQYPLPPLFDCFVFNDELDLLLTRLEVLSPVVHRFVLVEAAYWPSGKRKPLHFRDAVARCSALAGSAPSSASSTPRGADGGEARKVVVGDDADAAWRDLAQGSGPSSRASSMWWWTTCPDRAARVLTRRKGGRPTSAGEYRLGCRDAPTWPRGPRSSARSRISRARPPWR